jgi:hypothetical protein
MGMKKSVGLNDTIHPCAGMENKRIYCRRVRKENLGENTRRDTAEEQIITVD